MEAIIKDEKAIDGEAHFRFELPFIRRAVHLDDRGAQHIAWLACLMAERESSPIENKKRYARRMATFICGGIVAGSGNDSMWKWVYREFLPQIFGWLDRACSACVEDEPDWNVFASNPEISKDMKAFQAQVSSCL